MANAKQLLDYLASQEEAVLTYSADTSSTQQRRIPKPTKDKEQNRRPLLSFQQQQHSAQQRSGLNIVHIIKHVMSSAYAIDTDVKFIRLEEILV